MPRARHTDPQTSHDAANSVVEVTKTQLAIYKLLKKPMTDEQLVERYKAKAWASDSGIRSRRSELVELGLIERKSEAKTRSGRKAIVWGQA